MSHLVFPLEINCRAMGVTSIGEKKLVLDLMEVQIEPLLIALSENAAFEDYDLSRLMALMMKDRENIEVDIMRLCANACNLIEEMNKDEQ